MLLDVMGIMLVLILICIDLIKSGFVKIVSYTESHYMVSPLKERLSWSMLCGRGFECCSLLFIELHLKHIVRHLIKYNHQ